MFLNGSFKMHADVFAGRQIYQIWNKIFNVFQNENKNPLYNSSLAVSCIKFIMTSSCDEGKLAALFTEGVSSCQSMRLLQRSVYPKIFVLCPICLWLCEKKRSVSETFWIIWVVKRVLRVVWFREKSMMIMMIVSSISWAVTLRSAVLSQMAGRLRMRWHVRLCQWKLWQKVVSTHLNCLHVSVLSSFPLAFNL